MIAEILLCTDLDGTIVPNDCHQESSGARERFRAITSRPDVALAYVTGRNLPLVEDAIARYEIPTPDFAITDVGSRIYVRRGGTFANDAIWRQRLLQSWPIGTAEAVTAAVADIQQLRPQEQEHQNPFKVSYWVGPGEDHRHVVSSIEKRLSRLGIRANIVYSEAPNDPTGLLDLLPSCASKLHAIRHLMRQQAFSVKRTVFAGDSGNDLDVLTSDIPAILVKNASEEVRNEVVARTKSARENSLYLAQGGYLGMNGCYAAGVLEGFAHFFPKKAVVL